MEKKRETTVVCKVYIGLYWGYIGIMESSMALVYYSAQDSGFGVTLGFGGYSLL